MSPSSNPDKASTDPLRRLLFATYLVGAIGLLVELLLLEHTEGVWQWLPILFIGIGALALVGYLFLKPRWLARVFWWNNVVVFLCAALGVWLHFDGKAEFKVEIDPSLSGWELIWECLYGHSLPPVLAPGAMVLLGLVGLSCFFKHPIWNKRN